MVHILPEYMKPFYVAMLDLYEEISKEIGKDESSLHLQIAIGGVKFLIFLLYLLPILFFFFFLHVYY